MKYLEEYKEKFLKNTDFFISRYTYTFDVIYDVVRTHDKLLYSDTVSTENKLFIRLKTSKFDHPAIFSDEKFVLKSCNMHVNEFNNSKIFVWNLTYEVIDSEK